jgi:hypothetical protein
MPLAVAAPAAGWAADDWLPAVGLDPGMPARVELVAAANSNAQASRITDSRLARLTDWSNANPVTVQATPYQTLSVPDHRRMTISYVSPRVAANSTTS